MAAHIQVSNYADFKSVGQAMAANKVFTQAITGGTLSYVWLFTTDGNFIVSNCPSTTGSAAFTLPGSFATDFPGSIPITAAGAPPGAGQTAVPGLLLI
jgi:hypothetical protein